MSVDFSRMGKSSGRSALGDFFGARRARVAPLICESRSWQHGTFLGATMASETTAAATGQVGVIRRDPMAMLPFIGYNVATISSIGWIWEKSWAPRRPQIFHVNWFRRDQQTNKFLWPGFGENLRAILWALERVEGKAKATETPMGRVPTPDALKLDGLNLSPEHVKAILEVNPADWTKISRNSAPSSTKSAPAFPRKPPGTSSLRPAPRSIASGLLEQNLSLIFSVSG